MSENILVIHQGALGDVVLSFAGLVSLKQQRAGHLALLCKDQVGKIAHDLEVVDVHFSVETAQFCGLFSNDMSHHMKDFINDYDTIVIMGFSDDVADCIRQNHRGQTYRLTPRPPTGEETHVAVHMARQMQAKGLLRGSRDVTSRGPVSDELQLPCAARATRNPQRATRNSFLIHPGAGSQRKRWALDHFIEVAEAMREMDSIRVVFLIGPAESDLLPLVRKRAHGEFLVHEVEDLSEALALIKASTCFVGNDSGLAHLAAFMGVPTVSIFGPSSPKRWSPVGRATKVLRGEADCAPCFETAQTNCDDPQCLRGVSVGMVVEAVKYLGAV